MIKVANTLPDWIEKYASPGATKVEGTLTDKNAFWFLLTACCPLKFESYAILLHPFWINWKEKERIESQPSTKEEIDSRDFKKLSWKDFFSHYGKSFDINSAYEVQEELREKFAEGNKWPTHLWYPGSNIEYSDLAIIIKELIEIYGDQLTNYYYFLTNTKVWSDGDIIYQGYLSELEKLKEQVEIDDTPNAIYPNSEEWCIISDIDLPFTYIGGSSKLIDNITSDPKHEIYKLTPKFNEVKH
ncbi:MAG TPA: hypothetical protein VK809_01295 [Bacteroidia bacterium]|jgi:hypothetical protein|nr:hypothetical protein [Bacteroidia bacterium]